MYLLKRTSKRHDTTRLIMHSLGPFRSEDMKAAIRASEKLQEEEELQRAVDASLQVKKEKEQEEEELQRALEESLLISNLRFNKLSGGLLELDVGTPSKLR